MTGKTKSPSCGCGTDKKRKMIVKKDAVKKIVEKEKLKDFFKDLFMKFTLQQNVKSPPKKKPPKNIRTSRKQAK